MPEAVTKTPYVIVLANEKGGSGKSTIAMHLIVALMHRGYRVGSVDLDSHQRTLSCYLENRRKFNIKQRSLELPEHLIVNRSSRAQRDEAEQEEREALRQVFSLLSSKVDVIVADCPGSASHVGDICMSWADTLITPLNDSFIDLDVIARVVTGEQNTINFSHFAKNVWVQRKRRAAEQKKSIDWILMRNRLSLLQARNKIAMQMALDLLSKRIGFRVIGGFSERVIFRELFQLGLTVMDIADTDQDRKLTLSHLAARQEVRNLLEAIHLPKPASPIEKQN